MSGVSERGYQGISGEAMSGDPRFEIRLHLREEFAEAANNYGMDIVMLAPLTDILDSYGVTAETQLRKFARSIEGATDEELAAATGIGKLTADIVHRRTAEGAEKHKKYSRVFVLSKGEDSFFTHTPETDEMLRKLDGMAGGEIVERIQIVPVKPFHAQLDMN